MRLAFFILIQYRSVTDGQTDGRMDGHLCSGYTSACIACYANALVKTVYIYGFLIILNVKIAFVTSMQETAVNRTLKMS